MVIVHVLEITSLTLLLFTNANIYFLIEHMLYVIILNVQELPRCLASLQFDLTESKQETANLQLQLEESIISGMVQQHKSQVS